MWKVFAGFIVFALLALFVIMKGGDKVDMQGEAGGHSPAESSAPAHDTQAAPAAPVAPAAPAAAAPEASK
ncbi:MAG TPA: hypothetical protein VJ654_15520 [Noviherbaspirillum sp.]|nr:hypothetical protein [Noviherbaspirillum sp.]